MNTIISSLDETTEILLCGLNDKQQTTHNIKAIRAKNFQKVPGNWSPK